MNGNVNILHAAQRGVTHRLRTAAIGCDSKEPALQQKWGESAGKSFVYTQNDYLGKK